MKALKPRDIGAGRRKRRVELADTGEVLTSDEVLERLQQADAERASKRAKKTSGKTKTRQRPRSQSPHVRQLIV